MTIEQIRIIAAKNAIFIRKNLGLTQKQLADLIGVNRPAYGALEEGRSLSIDMVNRIAEYNELSLDAFLKTDIEASLPPLE